MGWRNGTLAATGEHDDLVMATWFVERAVQALTNIPEREPTWEPVLLTEVGIPRVRIGSDLDDWDRLDGRREGEDLDLGGEPFSQFWDREDRY